MLAGGDGRVSVAAVNSPGATVVAGDLDALAELAGVFAGRGWRTRPVPIGYAAHSAQVEAAEQELTAALAGVRPGPGRVAMISAMTGELVQGAELGAGYWYASLRAPVQFARAVTTLAGAGHGVFIEVSPHPVLAAAVTETLDQDGGGAVVTGTLRRHDGGAARLLASLARAHVQGAGVDWAAVLGGGTVWSCRRTRSSGSGSGRGRLRRGRGMWRRRGWARWVIRCWARRCRWRAGISWC